MLDRGETDIVVKKRAKLRRCFRDRLARTACITQVESQMQRATPREHHNPIVVRQRLDERGDRSMCVSLKSGVRRGLATTGRTCRNVHVQAEAFENTQRRNRDLRIELVDEAGDKESDSHVQLRN
jgi:hypothetical protein